jgi:hypothetical protein
MKQLNRKNFARPASEPWRATNPSVPGAGYENSDFRYDSFSVAQAAAFPQSTPMFQLPISGAKTKAQTNMKAQGTLANGETMKVRRVRVLITGCSVLADAWNIGSLCSGVLKIGDRDFITGPLLAFPGGAGIQATAVAMPAAVGTTAIQNSICNGDTNYMNAFRFEDDVTIDYGESIAFNVTAETAFNMTAAANGGTGATVYVFLDGRVLRKVS